MREALESHEGIRRLGFMAGVRSITNNLNTEDEAYRRKMLGTEEGNDEGGEGGDTPGSDTMQVMAARDVIVNPEPKAQAKPSSGFTTKQAILGTIAAALVGGTLVGVGATLLGNNGGEPVVDTDTDTDTISHTEIEVGDPNYHWEE